MSWEVGYNDLLMPVKVTPVIKSTFQEATDRVIEFLEHECEIAARNGDENAAQEYSGAAVKTAMAPEGKFEIEVLDMVFWIDLKQENT